MYEHNANKLVWDFEKDKMTDWQPSHAYTTAGQQIVTVTAHFSVCRDTAFTDTLTINDYPIVNIGRDTTICEGQSAIQLYNHAPTTAIVQVITPSKVNISIYSLNGKLLLYKKEAKAIDMRQLVNGMYIIKLTDSNGLFIHTEKIIKLD